MTVYIDSDYKCHSAAGEGLRAVDVPVFDGKCRRFIEGYRYIPAGESYDGFRGEMIAPHEDYAMLAAAQAQYEETLAELTATKEDLADADNALEIVGVKVDG